VSATILIVDDNAAQVDNTREVLASAGHSVLTADSVKAARAIEPGRFDVALVDLRLPDGEGVALAGELRERAPDALVILLTGFASVESAAAAVRAGAWDYLVKPVAPPDLLLTIEQALRQVRLLAERRELARRAQTAEKLAAVGTLTAGLSHEIRNPLNAAALQLAVLERRIGRVAEPERAALLDPLSHVRDEIRRLGHLLDDFLAFARPREPRRSPIELATIVDDVLGLVRPSAEEKDVRLDLHAQAPGAIEGDATQLKQVLLNLVINAIDAVPRGGRVDVAIETIGGEACVRVSDSGAGIPDELIGRVFEPFFTTKDAGSGLGLPIVHQLVGQHGGRVSIARSPLGGAAVAVHIPSAKSAGSV
jgi:two-component system, NtrC family, sensor histidine kinase HydH